MTLRLSVMSDLHHEHGTHLVSPHLFQHNDSDIAVVAGDVDEPESAIKYLSHIGIPVIYVAGNHEFYDRDIQATRNQLRRMSQEYPNVHFLDQETITLTVRGESIRFIGATLWTDYCLFGEPYQFIAMQEALYGMNDHKYIHHEKRLFTPHDALNFHSADLAYIRSTLEVPFDGKTVVVTHHGPSERCVSERYSGQIDNAAFCSNLDSFVANSGADIWISGHTHANVDTMRGNTRIFSNQHGYLGETDAAIETIDI